MTHPGAAVHEPSDKCAGIHCHWHNVDEPGPGYLGCFECGHLYRTAGDLRRRYRQQLRDMIPPPALRWGRLQLWWFHWLPQLWPWWPRIQRIYFCQECAHDF